MKLFPIFVAGSGNQLFCEIKVFTDGSDAVYTYHLGLEWHIA